MPKTSFTKKVFEHDKRVNDISKICIKLSTWKNHNELFLRPDCFLITLSPTMKGKVNIITKQHFQS